MTNIVQQMGGEIMSSNVRGIGLLDGGVGLNQSDNDSDSSGTESSDSDHDSEESELIKEA
jgi:hypothetical protein